MLNPWLAIAIVLAALGGCFLGLHQLRKRLAPNPEILRKLMHVLMGLIAATFPWLFSEVWPVLLLTALILPVLVLVRSGAAGSLQEVLHGVKRSSWGELLFPVSIALLFLLAQDDALLYIVPILILALADAVAALIGVYYGRTQYSTLEGYKSVEGSLAFLFVTFLCVHIALLLFTDVGRLESLLIGGLMGVIVMMFEAIAWRGLDNLFIPLSSFFLLQSYLAMDAADLTLKLLVIIALGLFVLVWRKRSTLDDSALVGAVLVAYAAWALGDRFWLAVPLLMFVAATWMALRAGAEPGRNEHTVYALLSISGAGLAWLMIGRGGGGDLFYPYALTFGAHLVMLGVSREHYAKPGIALPRMLSWVVLPGWLVVMLPYAARYAWAPPLLAAGLITLAMMLMSAILFLRLQPEIADCQVDASRWTRQALIATLASIVGWVALLVMGHAKNLT